ncbi:hypothetical protein R3P38DRAFT_3281682 [Favolaschia claudopus]|uniref:Uncharacterized protein n=1 Tax=Favolaschia claudopus TaxID=2862362 RepID=A0AAW0ADQ4_9AGAR
MMMIHLHSDLSTSAMSSIVDDASFSPQSLRIHIRIMADLRLAERKHEFDDAQLRRLAAQSVGQTLQDVDTMMEKFDDLQPHLPPHYARRDLDGRSRPVPRHTTCCREYGYSPTSDNAAQTAYIFMEFVKGTRLTAQRCGCTQRKQLDVASILRQLVKLESQIMSIPFPAGASLDYVDDWRSKVAGENTGCIPLSLMGGHKFCVGPDVRLHRWYGRRYVPLGLSTKRRGSTRSSRMQGDRRARRESVQVLEAATSINHIKNLNRYLLIAPSDSLIPTNPTLRAFCVRHPDLHLWCRLARLWLWPPAGDRKPACSTGNTRPTHPNYYDDPHSSFNPFPPHGSVRADGLPHATPRASRPCSLPLHGSPPRRPSRFFISLSLSLRPTSPPARWEAETHDLKAQEAAEAWGTRLAAPVAFAADDDNVH